jgi:hypothetical protein
MQGYLIAEFLSPGIGKKTGQRMVIGLIETFHLPTLPAGGKQFLEGLDDLGVIKLRLFQKSSRKTEGNLKQRIFGDKFREHPHGREIALVGNFQEDIAVPFFPEELVPVRMKPKRLMHLKIKGDEGHKNSSLWFVTCVILQ